MALPRNNNEAEMEVKETTAKFLTLRHDHPAVDALSKLSSENLLTEQLQDWLISKLPWLLATFEVEEGYSYRLRAQMTKDDYDNLANLIIGLAQRGLKLNDIEESLIAIPEEPMRKVFQTDWGIDSCGIQLLSLFNWPVNPEYICEILAGIAEILPIKNKDNLQCLVAHPKYAYQMAKLLKKLAENEMLSADNRELVVRNPAHAEIVGHILHRSHQYFGCSLVDKTFKNLFLYPTALQEIWSSVIQAGAAKRETLDAIIEGKHLLRNQKLAFCCGDDNKVLNKSLSIFFKDNIADPKNMLREIFDFLPANDRAQKNTRPDTDDMENVASSKKQKK